jgi:hypothetical protein
MTAADILHHGHILNLTSKVAFSLLVRGKSLDWTVMPPARASEGISERNSRAGFERGLKGLKATRTSVRKRVIMTASGGTGGGSDEGSAQGGVGFWLLFWLEKALSVRRSYQYSRMGCGDKTSKDSQAA